MSRQLMVMAVCLALGILAVPPVPVRGQPLCSLQFKPATPAATPVAFPPSSRATPVAFPSASPAATPSAFPVASPVGAVCMITIENFAFAPLDVAIRAGTTVTWVNFDNREHEVRILSTGDESGPIRPFSRYSYTFWTPGSYTYMNPEYPGQPWGTIDVS